MRVRMRRTNCFCLELSKLLCREKDKKKSSDPSAKEKWDEVLYEQMGSSWKQPGVRP